VTIQWINGDFYVMRPKEGFRLPPGGEIEVTYTGSDAMIKETDAPLGLYSIIRDDGTSRAYPVRRYSVAPFTEPDQINRHPGDREPIPTAEWLFNRYASITELPEDQVQLVVPRPRTVTAEDGYFDIGGGSTVSYAPGLESEATLLAAFLNQMLERPVTVGEAGASGGAAVRVEHREVETPGSYGLTITPDEGVSISGDAAGVFYGSQTLKALIPIDRLGRRGESIRVRAARITDTPAFAYRGMHLDVARNFHSVATVKRLLDAMAFYKLNQLQLHLTEDEGWRIEIPELPELTQVGAFRGHPTEAGDHLQPSYGSGPFADTAMGYGSGFYTRAQYVDLVRYARERHVEVIPEVDVPGHSRAAIKAMEYRYRRLAEEGRTTEADRYRLADPEDRSVYRSAQWYTDNVISVCRESAFTFLETVIDAFIEMHAEAGAPLATFHTGGDEVPNGAWSESPRCTAYFERHPEITDTKALQRAFFRRIVEYLGSKGIKTGGWEEVAMTVNPAGRWMADPQFANDGVVPYVWNSLWGAEDLGHRLANAGYPVVLCNVPNFYFDLAYNKDPREPGLYWGGFVDTRDAFEFVPYDVLKSIRTNPDGVPYTDRDFAGKEALTGEGRRHILGMQGQLWSETLKGPAMLEYRYLPKMLGLAERAWYGQPEWGSIADRTRREAAIDAAWNVFANALGRRELPRLDRFGGGYDYRLSPPGAIVENARLVVNTEYPGMVVRYTTDGSDPTPASPLYSEPFRVVAEVIKLSTFDSRGRSSLPTVIDLRR
jgi:hexosaminidase